LEVELEGEQINRAAGEAVKWMVTAHLTYITCNTDAVLWPEILYKVVMEVWISINVVHM